MFNRFYNENHEPFGSLIKNGLWPDRDFYEYVSTFSVFVVCKSAVDSIQKNSYVKFLNIGQ